MKGLSAFNIEIYKLSNSKHYYDFEVDDAFFENFENSPVEKGKLLVKVALDKRETLIEVVVSISGNIELTCDRSLELFDFPTDIEDRLIFKYGSEEMEVDDEITIITHNTQRINIAQFIYESIVLSVPYKKLHPKFVADEEEEDSSTGVMIYQDSAKDPDDKEPENDDEIDPRWEILKRLKNN